MPNFFFKLAVNYEYILLIQKRFQHVKQFYLLLFFKNTLSMSSVSRQFCKKQK